MEMQSANFVGSCGPGMWSRSKIDLISCLMIIVEETSLPYANLILHSFLITLVINLFIIIIIFYVL